MLLVKDPNINKANAFYGIIIIFIVGGLLYLINMKMAIFSVVLFTYFIYFLYDIFYDECHCNCFADLEKAIKYIKEAYKNNPKMKKQPYTYKIKIGSILIAEY